MKLQSAMRERATMANDAGADIAIRIHANGSENSSANGALVLIGSARESLCWKSV